MTKETNPGSNGTYISERVSPRTLEALMSNYKDSQQAFLELVDNAVSNRIQNQPLTVRVRVSKDELAVHNQGGKGLSLEGLRNYFVWGNPPDTTTDTISVYGVGGKGAAGFLGRSMEVICSEKDSDDEYKVTDTSWEARAEDELKTYPVESKKALTKEGYFRIKVTNLKREVNAKALSDRLADTYRPLLLDGSVKMTVNGKEVQPLQIEYIEDDRNLAPQTYKAQTRLGDWLILKVGVLKDGQQVKPGIRCYYHGRLVEDEQFFGHPKPGQMPQASKLSGEAHLDFAPVTPNKSTFIHSSAQWETAARRIHNLLTPWYEKLEKMKMEPKSRVEKYEQDLAKQAKRLIDHVLATTGILTKKDLPGESWGRLPPTPTGEPKTRGDGGGPTKREGQTAPRLEATVGETVKRWGSFHDYQVVPFGTIDRRADVIEENGRFLLKINSDHGPYQVAKKLGEGDLYWYQLETAVLTLCELKAKEKSVDEFKELFDKYMNDVASTYYARIKDRNETKRRKAAGTIFGGNKK